LFRSAHPGGIDLAALFNAAPNPYVIFDLELTIVGCNEAYLRETGRNRTDIVGRNLFVAFPSDPQSEGGKLLRTSLAKVIAEAKSDELALIPYDVSPPGQAPEVRYWSATHTPIFDDTGRLAFILQHTTDVTEVERLRSAAAGRYQAGVLDRAARLQAENTALAAQSDELKRLFQQSPSFMAVLSGPQHVFTLVNDAYAKLVGHRRDLLGKGVAEALPEVVEQGFVELLDQVFRTGEPFIGRDMPIMLQQHPGSPPEQANLDFIYQPIRNGDGSVAGIFAQGHDVTEQHRAREALIRQSEVLRLAQEAGGIGIFEWDLKTGTVHVSPAFAELYGLPPGTEAVPANRFAELVHPEDRGRLATSSDQSLDKGMELTEYRVLAPGGTRWVARRGTVMRNGAGAAERVVGAVYDLTARKDQEAQLALLAQETAHRFKNMLATVQAITTQTLRGAASVAEARDTIGARLVALGETQDLLTHSSSAAGIRDVVVSGTRLHSDTFGRYTIDGPNTEIDAKAVLSLGLMLHELSTNAVKYGALSTTAGRVEISWSEAADGYIDWTWREIGGPAVAPPGRRGFGSRLIERSLSASPGNSVELEYAPEGVICRARIRPSRW
jgi:PAS domain S-box-containing protein